MYKRSKLFDTSSEKMNKLYLQTAKEMNLPITEFKWAGGFKITFDGQHYFFRQGCTPINDSSVSLVMDNKYIVNRTLSRSGYPVPESVGITKDEYEKYKHGHIKFDEIDYPVVAKPTLGTHGGRGVVCNISSAQQLTDYLDVNIGIYGCISIEKYIPGLTLYRVLVLDGKVIGVTRRDPAKVTGDGRHTIHQLIEIENIKRKDKMSEVSINNLGGDPENDIILKSLGLTLESVLKYGKSLEICYKSNALTGGTMEALPTDSICKENADMLGNAARELGLNIVGFDFLCEDIGESYTKSRGYIIEANFLPDITIHEKPLYGVPVRVSFDILRYIVRKHKKTYSGYSLNIFANKRFKSYLPNAGLLLRVGMAIVTVVLCSTILSILSSSGFNLF